MTLFYEDGHLSDEGLQALTNGALDELQNLEAAEHLSFCDACLLQYTALLDDDTLLTPPAPLRDGVMRRIRRKATRILFNKYTTVAAAACIAVALWGSGFLPAARRALEEHTAETQPTQTQQTAPAKQNLALANQFNAAANSLTASLNQFFMNFSTPLRTDENPAKQHKQESKAREKQEAVFDKPTPPASSQPESSQPDK